MSATAEPRLLAQALQTSGRQLTHCSPTPQRDAEWLWGHALGRNHAWMHAHLDWPLTTDEADRGEALIRQRQQGYSVAHLCGEAGFMDFTVRLNRHALAPRPETETLIDAALAHLPPRAHILEWGTGSGVLALALARARPDCLILALDCTRTTLGLAIRNALALRVHNIRFARADWHRPWPDRRFDLILANPPYIALHDPCLQGPGLQREPRHALIAADQGTHALRRLAQQARHHVLPCGRLLLEHGADQGEACRRILHRAGWGRVHTLPDLCGQPRVVCGSI